MVGVDVDFGGFARDDGIGLEEVAGGYGESKEPDMPVSLRGKYISILLG